MEIPFVLFNESWFRFKPVFYVIPLFTYTGEVLSERLYVFDSAVVLSSVSVDYFMKRDSLEFILYNSKRMQRSKLHDGNLVDLHRRMSEKRGMSYCFESDGLKIRSSRNLELEIKEKYWRFVI